MKITRKAMLPLFWLGILLTSCNEAAIPSIQPTHTPVRMTETALPEPTATFDPYLATPVPPTRDFSVLATPKPDQQIYTDPDGWYSVNFPADLKSNPDYPYPPFFSRWDNSGDFFETGYLPKLGHMSHVMNVCVWLANFEEEFGSYYVDSVYNAARNRFELDSCRVVPRERGYLTKYLVRENPAADPQHRFLYLKTSFHSQQLADDIENSFTWLNGISQTTPEATPTSLDDEEAAFWKNTVAMPPNISVTESDSRSFEDYRSRLTNNEPTLAPKNTLEDLGYEWRKTSTNENYSSQLYRDGRLLFDSVMDVSPVYTFSTDSGPITAFVVELNTEEHFLIQNDAIHPWQGLAHVGLEEMRAPILYNGELLWAIGKPGVSIQKSNREVVMSFSAYETGFGMVSNFRNWNGHWILSVGDFLFQDGESINTKLGFQEIIGWHLIKGKPAYLFRKGASVGVSYNGQILPLRYDNVTNSRFIGSESQVDNLWVGDDFISFHVNRDGVWKYVLLEFK